MFLILCGDPKQVPQESFLMHPIDMISTMLQGTNKGKLLFPIKLTHLIILNMILEKKPHLVQMRMILPHTQFFNLLSILLHLTNLPRFLFPTNYGENFLRLQRSLLLSTTRQIKWLTQNHLVATLNVNLLGYTQSQAPATLPS